jgi:hypothetical protein
MSVMQGKYKFQKRFKKFTPPIDTKKKINLVEKLCPLSGYKIAESGLHREAQSLSNKGAKRAAVNLLYGKYSHSVTVVRESVTGGWE